MADAGTGLDQQLSDEQAQSLLQAVDLAFTQVMYARYGGTVVCVLAKGGAYGREHVLRQAVAGQVKAGQAQTLSLEMHPPGGVAAPGLGRGRGTLLTAIGVITLDGGRVQDVHVLTEIFDCHDPNEHSEAAALHEGVLLMEPDGFGAGALPGGGLDVARSTQGQSAAASAGQRRGWLPQAGRTRADRAQGLGNNGHRRAAVPALRLPVAVPLLTALGHAIAAGPLGGGIARIGLAVDGRAAAAP